MAEPAKKAPIPHKPADIVYRKTPVPGEGPPGPIETFQVRVREIAPAIMPLIIGFALLLVLIGVLGRLSEQEMTNVSFIARDRESQHSARLSLLLNLRLALTMLDNEARARANVEAQGGVKPPFAMRLNAARDVLRKQLETLERPPLMEEKPWQQLQVDMQKYIDVTEDARAYSLAGFRAFKTVDDELNGLFEQARQEKQSIDSEIKAIEDRAKKSIQRWTLLALIVGGLVTAGTIWEVQRRFKQMRRSMFEARRERTFTNQLLEGMVSAIAAIDEDDRIRSANAAFFKIFPGASIGASVLEKFAPDDAMKMLEAATATRVTRATYRGRWVSQIDNEEKSFDVYSSPLAINGDRGQILTLVDATEVAESERTLRRSESLAAVGQATTQVAHEIRNPLGSIRLGVSMLRDSVNDSEALNTIELVERGIKHLNKLVVDVTQFSRQKDLERTRVDLNEALERSIDLIAERIRDKNAAVQRRFSETPIIGYWDADQLRQVFVNVIANALDASSESSEVRISTEILTLDRDGNRAEKASYARIVVMDRGKGMDKATRDRIFEPFFTTKKRGTGLGLAIVKQIVEQHGGRITVSSEPGKGARFTIDLPV